MNLQGRHFLFIRQKHDARCTCCCLQQDAWQQCVSAFIPKARNGNFHLLKAKHKEMSSCSKVSNHWRRPTRIVVISELQLFFPCLFITHVLYCCGKTSSSALQYYLCFSFAKVLAAEAVFSLGNILHIIRYSLKAFSHVLETHQPLVHIQ